VSCAVQRPTSVTFYTQEALMPTPSELRSEERPQISIVDVHMPFGSMVVFMIKWAIASIPALIILAILGVLASGVITGIIASLGKR
jgi:hypothetical protein